MTFWINGILTLIFTVSSRNFILDLENMIRMVEPKNETMFS